MPGSFPVASKILHKYEQDRAYRLHRQKVHNRSIYVQALHNLPYWIMYSIHTCILYNTYIIYIVCILYIIPTYIYWVEV